MTARAEIRHQIPGRARLRLADTRGDPAFLQRLAEALAGAPGVLNVETNPQTGSLLIRHDAQSGEGIWQWARENGWFDVDSPPADAVIDRVVAESRGFGERLQATVGVDARTLMFIFLMVMGIRQAAKGEIVAPAITLFWYAMNTIGLPGRG
jgi:hypothetical protein